jgi:hypothetical protein
MYNVFKLTKGANIMWYTMLKHNLVMQDGVVVPMGTVWSAKAYYIKDCPMVEFLNVDEMATVGVINTVKASAKEFFTTPKRELGAVIEDSISYMEALYT